MASSLRSEAPPMGNAPEQTVVSYEAYSRDAEGRWVLSEAGDGESVRVSSLEGSLEVDRVYRGIALDPDPSSARPNRADR